MTELPWIRLSKFGEALCFGAATHEVWVMRNTNQETLSMCGNQKQGVHHTKKDAIFSMADHIDRNQPEERQHAAAVLWISQARVDLSQGWQVTTAHEIVGML